MKVTEYVHLLSRCWGDMDVQETAEEEDENDEEALSAIAQLSGSSTSLALKVNPSLHGGGSRWRAN